MEQQHIIGQEDYVICAPGPTGGPVYWSGSTWTVDRDQAIPYSLKEGLYLVGDLNGRNARLPGMHLEPVRA